MSGFGGDEGWDEQADAAAPQPADAGPWFVRHAGRRTGPFDGARLRTMARRGALGRLHSLSADGTSWRPATEVRAIFNADGSVAAEPAVEDAGDRADAPFGDGPSDDGFVVIAPSAPSRGASGSASVRPVVVGALVLGTAMLALPTSRGADGALRWWWSEGAFAVSVRGLAALALLASWVTAFLPPEPVRAASSAAVAAVLSAACGIALALVHPAALPAAALVPVAAALVALDSSGSRAARTVAGASIGLSAVAGAASVLLAVLWPDAWGFAAMALAAAGAAGLGVAGYRGAIAPAGGVFWGCIAAAAGCLGSMFAASLGALAGESPMPAALGATSAGLVLAFAALAWASVHEASASAHLLARHGDGEDA